MASEGSVIAYYLSEFKVPAGQEAAIDSEMASIDLRIAKEKSTMKAIGNDLVLDEVVTSGKRTMGIDCYV